MKKLFWLCMLLIGSQTIGAQEKLMVSVSNHENTKHQAYPIVLQLHSYNIKVKSALVTRNGKEIPSQLDDLNGDGRFDELCFMTNIGSKEKQTFNIELSTTGMPRPYTARVYADMMLTNKKIKSSNKQDLYISSLTVDRGVNPYWMLHHHGPAFENELVAYRIYFDHRQTVDIYGKYHQGLELKETQFYPDQEQKTAGFGDDVLWVGNTFGCGTLRGWDGQQPQMIQDVEHRTLRVLSKGPIRAIVEIVDENWQTSYYTSPVTMRTHYTLYAGRRDVQVDVSFDKSVEQFRFATGLINIKGSEEFSDHQGLRGCWGTDWPVSAKDSVGHKRETVGLGILIPTKYVVKELQANKDNYPFVIASQSDKLHYYISFGSANEDFGYHSSTTWFDYLKQWKLDVEQPVKVSIKKLSDGKMK